MQREPGETTVAVFDGDVELASWPLGGSGWPDLAVVDELARLQLTMRRAGCAIRIRGATIELVQLLDLVGLRDALGVEVRRQPELGEQGGVEEAVMPDDPVA